MNEKTQVEGPRFKSEEVEPGPPGPPPSLLACIQRIDRTVDLAMALGRAEKEIEQLKASNAWLLEQLRSREPWVSVDSAKKSNEESLARPALELDWSVRTANVIQSKFRGIATPGLPTVADVAAIPPKMWLLVRGCGIRTLREMDAMFKELDVVWPGEWPRK